MYAKIELTKGKHVLVDKSDFEWLSQWKWHYLSCGYAARSQKIDGKKKIVLMHRQILPGYQEVDHKDQDKLNCRRGNLRGATSSLNKGNKPKRSDNTSGYKGVCWFKQTEKWHAYITFNKKRRHLGYYKSIIDAAKAYNTAAVELFGEFACLNKV